jgi:hypothetical protein
MQFTPDLLESPLYPSQASGVHSQCDRRNVAIPSGYFRERLCRPRDHRAVVIRECVMRR